MNGRIRSEWPLILVIVLLLLASVFARYSGISHGGWNNVFQFLAHPDRFTADIFLAG